MSHNLYKAPQAL